MSIPASQSDTGRSQVSDGGKGRYIISKNKVYMAKEKTREELKKEGDELAQRVMEAESRLRENMDNDVLRRKELFSLMGSSSTPSMIGGGLRIESSMIPSWTQIAFELGKIVEKANNNVYLERLATENVNMKQAIDAMASDHACE